MAECRWGMHVPGPQKVFHRGHSFTRCAVCDRTLIDGARGWAPVPRGMHVTWRQRTPQDRIYAITANHQRGRLRFSLAALLVRLVRPAPTLPPGG